MLALKASFSADLFNALHYPPNASIYNKTDYTQSQEIAYKLKSNSAKILVYHSARKSGISFALFTPGIFGQCIQHAHYGYHWNGECVEAIVKKSLVKT